MKSLNVLFLSFVMLSGCVATPANPPSTAAKVFNIRDFGAKGNGTSLDTEAVQKTIEAASAAGGGTVLVPNGKYLIMPIVLTSNINLKIAKEGTLLISDDIANYPIVRGRYQDAITAHGADHLTISGEGTIDGQGAVWWAKFRADPSMTHRPYLIRLADCQYLTVSNITLINSPMFHLVPQNCSDVTIRNITIKSPGNAPNTDGIDPSGWNYLIADCYIDGGDDNIAIKPTSARNPGNKNFLVKNCQFVHGHGMSIGSGSTGGLDGLTVSNCTFSQTDYGIRIKAPRGNGGLVQNCTYENLQLKAITKNPISIIDYYPERNAPKDPATETPEPVNDRTPQMKNIVIRNVTISDCSNAGIIRGLPEAPLDGLTFSNVTISAATGMILYHAHNVHFEYSAITATSGEKLMTFDATVTGLK